MFGEKPALDAAPKGWDCVRSLVGETTCEKQDSEDTLDGWLRKNVRAEKQKVNSQRVDGGTHGCGLTPHQNDSHET